MVVPISGYRTTAMRTRSTALLLLVAVIVAACVIPMDTGEGAANMALEQVDAALYSMRDEAAILQTQIDSLGRELKKTDSLLRMIANLTGNPIQDPPTYIIPPN